MAVTETKAGQGASVDVSPNGPGRETKPSGRLADGYGALLGHS